MLLINRFKNTFWQPINITSPLCPHTVKGGQGPPPKAITLFPKSSLINAGQKSENYTCWKWNHLSVGVMWWKMSASPPYPASVFQLFVPLQLTSLSRYGSHAGTATLCQCDDSRAENKQCSSPQVWVSTPHASNELLWVKWKFIILQIPHRTSCSEDIFKGEVKRVVIWVLKVRNFKCRWVYLCT